MTWFLKVIHNLGSFVQELFSFYQTTADERRTAEKETSICWRTKGWAKQAYLSQQAKVTAQPRRTPLKRLRLRSDTL